MLKTMLSRPFQLDALSLNTTVTRTDHRLIASIQEGEIEILSVSLSRKFIESEEGERRFSSLPSLPEWLAQQAEIVFLSAEYLQP